MASPPDPRDFVVELDERLRSARHVDLGLGELSETLGTRNPADAWREARRVLAQRATDLTAALADLSAAVQRCREVEQVVRFTERGWPERHAELVERCRQDAVSGLVDWLDDWLTAVADRRAEAAERLLSMADELPPGSEVLVRRCRAAMIAVTQSGTGGPPVVLQAGAIGIDTPDALVPRPATRQALWVLLVRRALSFGEVDEAAALLERATADGEAPIFVALGERLKSLRPGADPARTDLMTAVAGSTEAMLEVARVVCVSATSRSSDLRVDPGMSAARAAVGSAAHLDQADQEVMRLLDPVPAEIHLALAERALAQGDDTVARSALSSAVAAGGSDAVIADAHERLAALSRGDLDGAVEHLVAATEAWGRAGQHERVLANADALLRIRPDDVLGRCNAAGAHLMLSREAPHDAAIVHARRGLELLEPVDDLVEHQPDTAQDDWNRSLAAWTRSYLDARLGSFEGEPTAVWEWRALADAFRSVLLAPDHPAMWRCATDAASGVELWAQAELTARRAAQLDGGREALSEHVGTLINLGDLDEAIRLLGEPSSIYEWNLLGHLQLRMGRPDETVRLYEEHPPARDYLWAWESYITGLLLTGRADDAVERAKDIDGTVSARSGESGNGPLVCFVALVLGDTERVARQAERLHGVLDHDGDFSLAVVRATQGRAEEAIELLVDFVEGFTSLDDVITWRNALQPLLAGLVAARGGTLPALAKVDEALSRLGTALEARRDPAVELAEASAIGAEPAVVALAKQLGRLVDALADGDVDAVEAALAAPGSSGADLSPTPLRAWIDESRTVDDAPVAPPVEAAPPVDEPVEEEPYDVVVELPTSWFASTTDPVRDHPLFRQAIPELRLTAMVDIPAIRVRAEDWLEPDRFRVLVHDDVAVEGGVELGRRRLTEAARSLVAPAVAALAEPVADPPASGDVSVPDEPAPRARLVELLSLSPEEQVLRRVEGAMAARAASASALEQAH